MVRGRDLPGRRSSGSGSAMAADQHRYRDVVGVRACTAPGFSFKTQDLRFFIGVAMIVGGILIVTVRARERQP